MFKGFILIPNFLFSLSIPVNNGDKTEPITKTLLTLSK